ncbi:MAG: RNA pseudouridine synthase, partial [Verrucomicrobiae bacterium]|nr:RNA pseudouridine synthase [Verrucomicrobiae bacterium]
MTDATDQHTDQQIEPHIELGSADVLYRDDALIAVAKPPGLVSQATPDPRRDHLLAAVTRYLMRVDGTIAPAPVLVHRLDRDTSGVVVLSLHPDAHGALGEAFRSREARKTYLAVVATAARTVATDEAWTIDNHLRVDRKAKTQRRVQAVRSGGDRAITDVRVLAVADGAALIEAR